MYLHSSAMDFFTEMNNRASALTVNDNLRDSCSSLHATIHLLKNSVNDVHRVAKKHHSLDGQACSHPHLEAFKLIHSHVFETFQAIENANSPSRRSTIPTDFQDAIEARIAVDRLKLDVLLSTIPFNITHTVGLWEGSKTKEKIEGNKQYYAYEIDIRRWQKDPDRRPSSQISIMNKWKYLQDRSYLEALEISSPSPPRLAETLHDAARHLYDANNSASAWHRWMHMMACAKYLANVGSCPEYLALVGNGVWGGCFFVQNYVEELRKTLFLVMHDRHINTPYMTKQAVCEEQGSFLESIGWAHELLPRRSSSSYPTLNLGSTESETTVEDDTIEIRLKDHGSLNKLLLHKEPDGTIKIDDKNPEYRKQFGDLGDLRQFTFCIEYGEKKMTTTRWPVRLNNGTSDAKFCFSDADSAYHFQRLVTGMRVCADFGPERHLKAYRGGFKSAVEMTGRLWIWQRSMLDTKSSVGPLPLSSSDRQFSYISSHNMSTRKIADNHGAAQRASESSSEAVLLVEQPLLPLIVVLGKRERMFRRNSSTKDLEELFLARVNYNSKVVDDPCQECGDNPCPHTMISSTSIVHLVDVESDARKTGLHYSSRPKEDRTNVTLHIELLNSEDRIRFEKTFEELRQNRQIKSNAIGGSKSARPR